MSEYNALDDRRPGKKGFDSPARLGTPRATARTAIAQRSSLNGLVVQRAETAPHRLSSSDVLALQRAMGNRAVQRILQTPQAPTAARTAHSATTGLLQRRPNPMPIGPEGGSVDTGLERRLAHTQSSGSSLPAAIRRTLEPKLGADLGSVKVHTDSTSAQLNRELGAKAFTHKNHIYYGAGQSPSDIRLTAHEAVHTIQQGAVKPNRVQRSQRRAPGIDAENERQTSPIVQRTSAPGIQRFITREAMIKLAGAPSWKAQRNESTYVQILDQLDAYQAASDSEKRGVLKQLSKLCTEWIRNHKTNTVRGRFINALKQEVQARMMVSDENKLQSNLSTIDYLPSRSAAKQAEREETAANPDWTNPKLADTPADKYVFTIAVAVEYDDQLKFALARAHSTARNKIRGMLTKTPLFGIRGSKKKGEGNKVIKRGLFKLAAPKDQEGIKAKAARQTLEQKGETDIDEQKIAQVAARSAQVGHTWVKFRKMVGSDLKEVYSYGMWPEDGYGHPSRPVPGIIRHPDVVHENAEGEKQLYLDKEVAPKNFNAGLQLAVARLKQKPDYTLTGYNCTTFAREIASKVGVSFPKAATVFPAELSKGFFQKILSPNRLYESMEAMQMRGDARVTSEAIGYDEVEQRQNEARENERLEAQARMERELEDLSEHLVMRSTLFWPGESFGDEEPFMVDESSEYRRVWSTGKTAEYHDPDLNATMKYALVKLVRFGKIVTGWLHADAIESFD